MTRYRHTRLEAVLWICLVAAVAACGACGFQPHVSDTIEVLSREDPVKAVFVRVSRFELTEY